MSNFNRRSTIDRNSPQVNRHRPSISTVFSRQWIGIDRGYRPWPIDRVDKSVDRCRYLDRCWDHFSPHVGPWLLGRSSSGTIFHHLWNHRSIVLFSDFSEKRGLPIFLGWIHIDGRFRPIFFWKRWSMRYRPYFQVSESASTVDINRILK